MRILHIAHGGLPDGRIEKNAMLMAERGHELFFLGGRPSKPCEPFVRIEKAITTNDTTHMIGRWIWHKKIRSMRPDIIHAHDILAVSNTFGLGYPVVYDDHEWWTRNYPIWFGMRNIVRKILSLPAYFMIPRWEKEALTSYATLTVSESIAESHRKQYRAWVRTTQNYPRLGDHSGISSPKARSGNVYSGSDVRHRVGIRKEASYRDMTGLPKSVKFDKIYGLSYQDMHKKLMTYKVGLIPWSCHPLHHYASPTKAYDYLHAGLQVVSPRTMTVLHGIPFVHFFDSLDEIPDIISSMPDVDPKKIQAWASKNCIWDVYVPVILEAYAEAIRRSKIRN